MVDDKGFCSFHPLALLMPDPGCPTSTLQLMAFMPDQPYDLVGLINPPQWVALAAWSLGVLWSDVPSLPGPRSMQGTLF